jgi:hypothetical protein
MSTTPATVRSSTSAPCALGCEGSVSPIAPAGGCWIKVKNPAAPAVTREAEEEWEL